MIVKPKRVLTKFDLAKLFGLVYKSGQFNSRTLSRDYFTDSVLERLGITREQYKKIQVFNFDQTMKIVEIMHIDRHDLAFIGADREYITSEK